MKSGENNWVHLLQKEIKLAPCETIIAFHSIDHTQKLRSFFAQLLAKLLFNFLVFKLTGLVKITGFVFVRRKSHSPLFPPFTMYLLVAEKASGKETVVDWLATESAPAELGEFRVEQGHVCGVDFTASKTEKLP